MIQLRRSWYELLKPEFEKDYFKKLQCFLENEYAKFAVYPKQENIFNALNFVSLNKIKVVIIGQDPYHEPGQAQGLSFSVPDNFPLPPSLVNIFKEIESDLNIKCSDNGNLERWAKQGVLLLNTVLTVEAHRAGSHRGKGWETFTTEVIKYLNETRPHLVFILWGRDARNKKPLIDAKKHLILESPHPSPLSAYNGFFGNHHFSKTNEFLKAHDMNIIEW